MRPTGCSAGVYHGRVVRRVGANLVLLIGTMLVLLVVAEVALRLLGVAVLRPVAPAVGPPSGQRSLVAEGFPLQLYRALPDGGLRLVPSSRVVWENHWVSHLDVEIRTNSLGFRGPEVPSRRSGETRVLVLGDSITLGDYLPEDETYPALLERCLGHRLGGPVRVINAGVGSVDLANEHEILIESGLGTRPDLVLVGLYLNDGQPSPTLLLRPLPGVLVHSVAIGFIRTRAAMLLWELRHASELSGHSDGFLEDFKQQRRPDGARSWRNDPRGMAQLIVRAYPDWGAAWNPVVWRSLAGTLSQMREATRQSGARLGVVLFPVRYQVEAEYLEDAPQRLFAATTAELGLEGLDLLPLLRQAASGDRPTGLYFDQCHLTPRGNALVAEALADFTARVLGGGSQAGGPPAGRPH